MNAHARADDGALHAAAATLGRRYLLDFPREAAQQVERIALADAAALLAQQPEAVRVRVWESLASDVAARLLGALPQATAAALLAEAEPAASAAALSQARPALRQSLLGALQAEVAGELRELMAYPHDAAGHLMDPHVAWLRTGMNVGDALFRLKGLGRRGLRELFVVDEHARLVGRVEIQDLAVADDAAPLADLMQPLIAVANDMEPREVFVERLQRQPIHELPVVDADGRFVGVIGQSEIVSAVKQESSLDAQAMVGASRNERALSPPAFAIARRLPWLQINLLTAFLAAGVVALFEGTIAKFTALAVLLPVVAGQSGNAGAQALAVTVRALALREVTLRQWHRLLGKEALVGIANGLAVALTTGLGVYLWSGSAGLVLVCMLSMVISMIVAGIAGAMVPVLLKRFGQDPALASTIILTTVTDVVGFSSFLGIATLLSSTLTPG